MYAEHDVAIKMAYFSALFAAKNVGAKQVTMPIMVPKYDGATPERRK